MDRDNPRDAPIRVAGADGCRDGWVVVLAEAETDVALRLEAVEVVPCFADLLALTRFCDAVSVDIPIGFSADGWREADTLARRFIGPRRSSVFPPPPRPVLEAGGGYATLNSLAKGVRAGLSQQTYNILPKMREADACMTPALQQRVHESHPEVSFCALNGDCLPHAKRRPEGKLARLRVLEGVFGEAFGALRAPRGAALDDLYDAAVLAWTASRIARGKARRLPESACLDSRGLRMEIVY